MANVIIAQLLFSKKKTHEGHRPLYHSPGGSVTAGWRLLLQSIIKPDVSTICIGAGGEMAPVLLRRREGKTIRASQLEDSHPRAVRRFEGQAADIEIHAAEMLSVRSRLYEILSKHSGRTCRNR